MTDQSQSAREMVELADRLQTQLDGELERDGSIDTDDLQEAIAVVRLAAQAAPGEIKPHLYVPDYQAMGDCRTCGHEQNKPWHIDAPGESVTAISPDILAFIQQVATHAASDRQNTRAARALLKRDLGTPAPLPQDGRDPATIEAAARVAETHTTNMDGHAAQLIYATAERIAARIRCLRLEGKVK